MEFKIEKRVRPFIVVRLGCEDNTVLVLRRKQAVWRDADVTVVVLIRDDHNGVVAFVPNP
jgi:hypothetical protein